MLSNMAAVNPWGVGVTQGKLSVEVFRVVLAWQKNLVFSLYVKYESKTHKMAFT